MIPSRFVLVLWCLVSSSAFGQMNLDTFTEARYHLANSVDANGNGTAWQKNPQGVVTLSVTYKNGLPDGDFLWPGGGGPITGHFAAGAPVGLWRFTLSSKTVTINLRNGNGYWAVPYAINGQDIQYAEEGQLINGLREGIWYSAAGANIEVSGDYVHGKKEGSWRSYSFNPVKQTSDLVSSETFVDNVSNGPFTCYLPRSSLTIIGETKDGSAAFDSLCSGNAFPPPTKSGKAWGTWKFYGNGMLLGENTLTNGNGHFVAYSALADGSKRAEGDLANGLADGVWSFYDNFGRMTSQVQYSAGTRIAGSEVDYPINIDATLGSSPAAPKPIQSNPPAPPTFVPKSCNIPPHDAFCGTVAQPVHVACHVICNNPAKPTPVCTPDACQNGITFAYPNCYCR